ncbi:hypothetical protein DPMN_125346 [Dreissena polymorpha]|uniref:Helicase-associated domain-containing protein n=1 Tax=Dreissena polymorpha TaxID=45954 RepID=A0A9D4GU90_DREPO|nr:hypothetical protein DPMN_125346 [Dreissena polymorpha]
MRPLTIPYTVLLVYQSVRFVTKLHAPYTMQARQPRRRDLTAQREMEEREVWLRNLEGGVNTDKRSVQLLQAILSTTIVFLSKIQRPPPGVKGFSYSITIDDVVYVIDGGRIKVKGFSYSITIDDVVYVIDGGRIKVKGFSYSITIDDVVYVIDGGRIKVKGFSYSITIDDVVYMIDGGRIKVKGFSYSITIDDVVYVIDGVISSITIDDVVYVIDGGRIKVKGFSYSITIDDVVYVIDGGRIKVKGFSYSITIDDVVYVIDGGCIKVKGFSYSITIDDVVYVIDGGRIKVKGFSPDTNMASLDSQLVSKANARQRRGRAGRVQPGECYHLYSGYQASIMDNYMAPEILRTRLEELCLTIKLLNLGKIVPFVQKAMQPPSLAAVESAIVNLQDLNALDKEENLLPLGKHLARMPLDPHTGKMILYGAMFKCLDPILTIAASLNFKDPFFAPLEKKAEADQARMKLAENCLSDHITLVKAYNKWERCRKRGTHRQFCYDNFLSDSTLVMLRKMRDQLAEVLHELGFLRERHINQSEANVYSGNESLVKAIVCAGLYPNIGMIGKLPKNKWSQIQFQLRSGRCKLFPGSVAREIRDPRACWVVYHKIMKTSDVWMYDCSVVTPYSLLFFGGDIKKINANGQSLVCVDDWIKFKASPETVTLVKQLRQELDHILDEIFSRSCHGNTVLTTKEEAILRAIADLVTTEDNYASTRSFDR